MTGRTGRRPGATETRSAILESARRLFGEKGYDGATVRAIATSAGVDPALVHHFFGSKQQVFVAAMEFPFAPEDVIPKLVEGDPDRTGERVVRFFLSVWDDPRGRDAFFGLMRSATTNEPAAAMLRQFVARELLGRVARASGAPLLRAEAVGAQLMGMAMLRYVLKVEPMASADDDTLVALVAPVVQHYIAGD